LAEEFPQARRVLCNRTRLTRHVMICNTTFRPLRRGESSATRQERSRSISINPTFRPLRRGESSATKDRLQPHRNTDSFRPLRRGESSATRALAAIDPVLAELPVPSGGASPLQRWLSSWRGTITAHFPSPQAGRVLCNDADVLGFNILYELSVPSGGASPLQPERDQCQRAGQRNFPSPQAGRVLCNSS